MSVAPPPPLVQADTPPLVEPAAPRGTPADRGRLVGPDVVRAVALIGVVVMNFHGYLINAGRSSAPSVARVPGYWDRFFDPWTGPLATRFAATFVLTAGVGVTLLTRRSLGDPAATAAKRWTLARRGLLLYGVGLVFYQVWPGSILPYYGVMFLLAAGLFTLPTLALAGIGAAAAVAGAAIRWWAIERTWDGHPTTWLHNPPSGSPRGLVFNMFVNGTHPLLPWLAFFCAGMIVGRLLGTAWWRPVVGGLGLTLFGFATMLSATLTTADRTPLTRALASNDPFDRGLLYTASALGTALVAFSVITALARRWPTSPPVVLLSHAGQMTLTLYVLHIFVFNAVVHWWGWIEPGGLDVALTFALAYWVCAITAGSLWHRHFGIGPAEWLYRKLSE